MLAHKKQQEPNTGEEGFSGEEEFESERPKKFRIREVDFMRVEDTLHGQTLSPFELEVKEKLASVKSPLEVLIAREENVMARRNARRKIWKLLAKAGLTRRQKQAFWLFYLDGLPVREVARRLGIKKSSAHELKCLMARKIERVIGKKLLAPPRGRS